MNRSKTGLNDLFYKWCDEVRRATRKIKEFNEKLMYYEGKLVGYNSASYDYIISKKSSKTTDDKILFWIDKIDKLEKNNVKYYKKRDEYLKFCKLLTERQKLFMQILIDRKTESSFHVSYEESKTLISTIARKWYDSINRS
ncbi:MAG: hypothetical protein JXR48_09290 [Candidatus Delongbacteria bacterium]|nr:hypothetical protein [Candidatus Delongbacteria bacterium]